MNIGFDDCMKVISNRMAKGEMCLINKNQKCIGHPLKECIPCINDIIRNDYKIRGEQK